MWCHRWKTCWQQRVRWYILQMIPLCRQTVWWPKWITFLRKKCFKSVADCRATWGRKVQYYEMQNGAQTQTEKTISSVARGKAGQVRNMASFQELMALMYSCWCCSSVEWFWIKWGIRFTGMMSSGLMFMGALIKWYALSSDFGDAQLFGMDMQVALASLGFAIFGMGAEIFQVLQRLKSL